MENPFAPSIMHIPPELLGEIFLFFQAVMEADGANPLVAITPLTAVCRRWRETALAEQALWAAAVLGAPDRRERADALAHLAVSRSGQRPLRVHLSGSRLSYPPPVTPRSAPAPAWDALLAARPRWAELSAPPHLLDLILAPPSAAALPALVRLTLVDPHKAFLFPATLDALLHAAPRLRAVTLKGVANTLHAPLPWAQLTEFTGDYLAYDGLFRLLNLCPALERLSVMAHKAPMHGPRCTHTSLRALDLAAADVAQLAAVLARLDLPALRTLALRPVDTGAPTCIPDPAQRRVRAFFERHGPGLRSLALAGVGLYLHVLTAVLRALPELRALALDEVHGWTAADARGLLARPELLPKLENLTYTFALQNSLARFVADVVDIVNVRWARPPPPRWAQQQPSREAQQPSSREAQQQLNREVQQSSREVQQQSSREVQQTNRHALVYTTPAPRPVIAGSPLPASPSTPPPPSPSPSPSVGSPTPSPSVGSPTPSPPVASPTPPPVASSTPPPVASSSSSPPASPATPPPSSPTTPAPASGVFAPASGVFTAGRAFAPASGVFTAGRAFTVPVTHPSTPMPVTQPSTPMPVTHPSTPMPVTHPSTPMPSRNSLGPTSSVLIAAAAASTSTARDDSSTARDDSSTASDDSSATGEDAESPSRTTYVPPPRTLPRQTTSVSRQTPSMSRQTTSVSRGASPTPSSSSLASSIKQYTPSTPTPTKTSTPTPAKTSLERTAAASEIGSSPAVAAPALATDSVTPVANLSSQQAASSEYEHPYPRALRTLCVSGQGGLWYGTARVGGLEHGTPRVGGLEHDSARAGGALRALREAKAAGLDVRVRVGGRVWV